MKMNNNILATKGPLKIGNSQKSTLNFLLGDCCENISTELQHRQHLISSSLFIKAGYYSLVER